MQKGKGLYSTVGVWTIAVIPLLISTFTSNLYGFDHLHSWNVGMGGVARLGPDTDYLFSDCSSALKGVLVSSSKPYSIEGLSALKFESFYSTRNILFTAGVGSLKHDLYHEELLQTRLFLTSFDKIVVLGVVTNLLRKNFSGYDPLVTSNINGSVSLGKKNIGRVVLRTDFGRDDAGEFYSPFISISVVISPVELIFDFDSGEWKKGDNRSGIILPVDSNLYLLSGYRFATGEVSGGVLYRRRRMILSVSCSSHPVLGETYCVGAVRMW